MSIRPAARKIIAILLLLLPILWPLPCRGQTTRASGKATVDVILWFDTEDYLLPADDDADKRLAEMLTERGIRATFKVVGEKARELEHRGRHDVIAAMKRHAIGYHSNFHSVHPTPAEYLAEAGLLDGIGEFVRREARGAADVRRIFDVPSLACYGQPGSSWAPQAIAALPQCGVFTRLPGAAASDPGVPVYLDAGKNIALNDAPYWYEGALVVYALGPYQTRMDLFEPDALASAERRFTTIAEQLEAQGGGLISIYYHPCEWVAEQFWDAVNFRGGRNPPREEWKPPGQFPAEKSEAAYARFGQYVDFMRARPGVRFVTAADLPAIYPDRVQTAGISSDELKTLAERLTDATRKGIDAQTIGDKAFSPADQFAALALAIASRLDPAAPPTTLLTTQRAGAAEPMLHIPAALLGPDAPPPAGVAPLGAIAWPAFRDATLDVRDFVLTRHRMPARVFVGPDPVAPSAYLVAMASAYLTMQTGGHPDTIPVGQPVELLTEHHVAPDTPALFGGWIIHRPHFRAPQIVAQARLAAWTLKPALRE